MTTREWIGVIVFLMMAALWIGVVVAGPKVDIDQHTPGFTRVAASRRFLVRVAKYAALFLVAVFLIVLLFGRH